MASTTVPGSMLSSSTASAPARAASATWSSGSHSISTMRPGHSARARRTASVMLVPARWLSLTSTASERPARWLVPAAGAHGRLLEGAQARRGLAGVEDLRPRVALVGRRDEARGQGRDTREVAQEVERRPLGGEDRSQRARHLEHRLARPTARRRRPRATRARARGRPARKASSAQSRPGQHAVLAGPQREARRRRPAAPGRRHVALGTEVLGQRRSTASPTAPGV